LQPPAALPASKIFISFQIELEFCGSKAQNATKTAETDLKVRQAILELPQVLTPP